MSEMSLLAACLQAWGHAGAREGGQRAGPGLDSWRARPGGREQGQPGAEDTSPGDSRGRRVEGTSVW